MIRLAELSIRFPKRALAALLVVVAALGVLAFGISDQLAPSKTVIAGTESDRAAQLAEDEFGPSVLVPILLQGPARELDEQGPALVTALRARSDTKVLSAWDPQQDALRPDPGAAMVVASVARSEEEMAASVQGQIEDVVDGAVSAPVRASVTGQPSIDIALRDAALDGALRASLIALPLVLLALLLVLRRPLAALAVTVLAALAALAGIGVLALLARLIDTDPIAVPSGALTGLALGGVYAMTMTQRFSQDAAGAAPTGRAASAPRATRIVQLSGRGVLVGGSAYVLALFVASRIAPSEALTSVGIGSLVCGLVAMVLAVLAMPALLVLLGRRLDVLMFAPPGAPHASADQRLVVRHAAVAGIVATVALAVLALPVLSIDTGPPDIAQLPSDSDARQSFETVGEVMGPGWATPFSIVVVDDDGAVTSQKTLTAIADLQRRIADDPRVASVNGPGALVAQTADLKKLPAALEDSKKLLTSGKQDLARLERGLGTAGAGALQLQAGLVTASSGAARLATGGDEAAAGSARLRAGLAAATAGSKKISAGLDEALTGAEELRSGAGQALAGATLIDASLGALAQPVASAVPQTDALAGAVARAGGAVGSASDSTRATIASLDEALASLGTGDPGYAATQAARASAGAAGTALAGASGALDAATAGTRAMAAQIRTLSSALTRLHEGSGGLQTGIGRLQQGNTQLATGLGQLNSGGQDLTAGLVRLTRGAGQLESGLGRLSTGAGALAVGLQGAVGPTGELAGGLDTMHAGVARFSRQLPSPRDLEELSAASPGLFASGYFVLAAVSGAPAADRNVAGFIVNLDRGGTAGQIVVVSKTGSSSDATHDLSRDLQTMAARFARDADLEAAVGGPAGNLTDYRAETASRIAPALAGVALAVALLLMLLLRSILVPLVATLSALLASAATFGILTLLFSGDDPLLGGPGYIDPMSIIAVFTAAFGLSAVFAGILLDEVRQELLAGGDVRAAVETTLRRSARAGALAGLVVALAAVPFAAEDLLNLRQFAVGFGVMALLDVLLMRALQLPAAIEILGGPAWWPTGARGREPRRLPPRPATP